MGTGTPSITTDAAASDTPTSTNATENEATASGRTYTKKTGTKETGKQSQSKSQLWSTVKKVAKIITLAFLTGIIGALLAGAFMFSPIVMIAGGVVGSIAGAVFGGIMIRQSEKKEAQDKTSNEETIERDTLKVANSLREEGFESVEEFRTWLDDEENVNEVIKLDFSQFGLKTLPREIGRFKDLECLKLPGNQLTSLPEELSQLTSLQELVLSYNRLNECPEAVTQLTSLETLDISHNELTSLSPDIGNLVHLELLNLSHNKFESLQKEIGRLAILQQLYLENNQLTELPAEVCQLIFLRQLMLRGNQLQALPNGITSLRNLEVLDLTSNRSLKMLSWAPSFLTLDKLRELYVRDCGLEIAKKEEYDKAERLLKALQDKYCWVDVLE